MSLLLNSVDVYKAAVLLEKRGAEFYRKSAEQTQGKSRDLLLRLSEMEKGHAEFFNKLLKEIEKKSRPDETPNADNDEKDFLEALTSGRIFTEDVFKSEGNDIEKILEKAMQIEKNSVFFYSAVKDSLRQGLALADIDRLIAEEVKHYYSLNRALTNLQN
ncbi:MAG: ferritin family protein [Candidatus Rifleibacteriota bacterium]